MKKMTQDEGQTVTDQLNDAAIITQFDQVHFIFHTGSDDLRGNSQLYATLLANDTSTPIVANSVLHEKDEDDGWRKGSSVHKDISLNDGIPVSRLRAVRLLMRTNNAAFQNDDQWVVDAITILIGDFLTLTTWVETSQPTVFNNGVGGYEVELTPPNIVQHI